MAQCRLRSYDANPPGNFPYVQTQGIKHEFTAEPVIEAQAKIVSSFRAANALPRASVKECLEDIDHYTAARLGCHRSWTVPINSPAEEKTVALPQSHPLVTKPCRGCGAQIFSLPNP